MCPKYKVAFKLIQNENCQEEQQWQLKVGHLVETALKFSSMTVYVLVLLQPGTADIQFLLRLQASALLQLIPSYSQAEIASTISNLIIAHSSAPNNEMEEIVRMHFVNLFIQTD